MKLINSNPFDLEVKDGEIVTFKIAPKGTLFLANYLVAKDGSGVVKNTVLEASPLRITFKKKGRRRPTDRVRLLLTYSNTAGGKYAIDVAGNKGDAVSHDEEFQGSGLDEGFDAVKYTFTIV